MVEKWITDSELIKQLREHPSYFKYNGEVMAHLIADRLEAALERIEKLENPILEIAPEHVILRTESGDHWVKKHLLEAALKRIETTKIELNKIMRFMYGASFPLSMDEDAMKQMNDMTRVMDMIRKISEDLQSGGGEG